MKITENAQTKFPRMRMVEIFGGRDDNWGGWHNLFMDLSENLEDSICIQGPIDPDTSINLKLALKLNGSVDV